MTKIYESILLLNVYFKESFQILLYLYIIVFRLSIFIVCIKEVWGDPLYEVKKSLSEGNALAIYYIILYNKCDHYYMFHVSPW